MTSDAHGSADERPSKRPKRGKYIMRACLECQKRKIRCDGGTPCLSCVSRNRTCITNRRRDAAHAGDYGVGHAIMLGAGTQAFNPERVLIDEILVRIGRIETQMKTVTGHLTGQSAEEPGDNATADNHEQSRPYLNVENEDIHTFVGEACSIHSLRLAEAKLDQLGLPSRSDGPLPPARPLTPMLSPVSTSNVDGECRSWLHMILRSHGIVPDKRQWDVFSRVYLDEIHGIYPLLHPPTVRQTYDYLWDRSFSVSPTEMEKDGESKISIAIVFLCVALGRCLVSSRTTNADAAHSAGWSLYSVAMHLLRDFLDITQDHPVIYLFRLDAKEKADRALANAISSAHALGLHRKATYAQMTIYQDELFARMWWCLYAFDRRLSMGSGRPPIIQDVDYDTQNPRNLGDEWLEQHKSSRATAAELEDEIKTEISSARSTPIPYLGATISFAKVSGDVWKAVYGLHAANRSTPGIVHDYLDLLLENWRQTLPPHLRYEADRSYEDQFSGLEWWQVKECLFAHVRYMFLKLQIRKPVAASNASGTGSHGDIANESARAQIAYSIIQFFQQIPDEYPKYVFSLMDYIIGATIVLVAIVVQNPGFKDRYRDVIVAAVQAIALYCRKTWVSGKTIRVIARLNRMVQNTFGPSVGQELNNRSKIRNGKGVLTREGHAQNQEETVQPERNSTPPTRTVERIRKEHHPHASLLASPDPSRGYTSSSVVANPWSGSNEAPAASLSQGLPFSENRNATAGLAEAASLQEAPRRPTSPPDTASYNFDTPQLWQSETSRDDFDDLLSLATADFDFEQTFNGSSHLIFDTGFS